MGIILPHERLGTEKIKALEELLGQFLGEVSQCSVHGDSTQVVLNDYEISTKRGQEFLQRVIDILGSTRWGTDLPLRHDDIPDCYVKYELPIPYDPKLR